MPGSVTSVFSEPYDFQAALREDGVLGMLITGGGPFRARLTQITLHRPRLLVSRRCRNCPRLFAGSSCQKPGNLEART
jgi:hypothetical protein